MTAFCHCEEQSDAAISMAVIARNKVTRQSALKEWIATAKASQ